MEAFRLIGQYDEFDSEAEGTDAEGGSGAEFPSDLEVTDDEGEAEPKAKSKGKGPAPAPAPAAGAKRKAPKNDPKKGAKRREYRSAIGLHSELISKARPVSTSNTRWRRSLSAKRCSRTGKRFMHAYVVLNRCPTCPS